MVDEPVPKLPQPPPMTRTRPTAYSDPVPNDAPPHISDIVRSAAAHVAGGSAAVVVRTEGVGALADDLIVTGAFNGDGTMGGPWQIDHGDVEQRVGLILALDTINFGSGWHTIISKRPGLSGSTSMATALREWVAAEGSIRADRLRALQPADTHAIFDQPSDDPEIARLMTMQARALADLGELVDEDYDGSFLALVEDADGSSSRLVGILRTMPSFDDVATWHGTDVPILKRAQLAAADLHRNFGGDGPGRFDDLDRLTAFADNLVPHVLFIDGVLTFDDELRDRIDRGELLEPGSIDEVEIRVVGLHAVELLRSALRSRGLEIPSWELDGILWQRGAGPTYKAVPRHRARSPYY